MTTQVIQQGDGPAIAGTGNPFLDVPNITGATEFKKGYVMRKCCYDSNGKKSMHFFLSLCHILLALSFSFLFSLIRVLHCIIFSQMVMVYIKQK